MDYMKLLTLDERIEQTLEIARDIFINYLEAHDYKVVQWNSDSEFFEYYKAYKDDRATLELNILRHGLNETISLVIDGIAHYSLHLANGKSPEEVDKSRDKTNLEKTLKKYNARFDKMFNKFGSKYINYFVGQEDRQDF